VVKVRDDWQQGRIPRKYQSTGEQTIRLKEGHYPSHELLAEYIHSEKADVLAHNLSVFEYTLDKTAEALLKMPAKARFSVTFWTTAPREYDLGNTVTKSTDEYTDAAGHKTGSRQVEVYGPSEEQAKSNAEHQKYRYESGMHAVGGENQAEVARQRDAETAKRRIVWAEESRQRVELLVWMQDPIRTADEIRSRKDEADRLNLMGVGGYGSSSRGLYFQALSAAEDRDAERAEAKEMSDKEARRKRIEPLMIPQGAILRPIYQIAPGAAETLAEKLLNKQVTEADIRSAVLAEIPNPNYYARYGGSPLIRVVMLPGKRVYRYSQKEHDEEPGKVNEDARFVKDISQEYKLFNRETFALLPTAMQAFIRQIKRIPKAEDLASAVDTDKIYFHEDQMGKLYAWNTHHTNWDVPSKAYAVFDEKGERVPATSKRHREFVVEIDRRQLARY
jgi:hypothetical protein